VVNDELRSGRLVQLLGNYAEAAEFIRVIYPSKRHLSADVRFFIDKLVEAWLPIPPSEK
jgi:DNA-binding transcriptional LysR family regulator